MAKRSLYQCFQAKVKYRYGRPVIYCRAGHRFPDKTGVFDIERLQRDALLELNVCQSCKDYDEMGPPIPKKERGWINKP